VCFVEIYLVFQKLILTFEGVIALQEIMWKFFLILLLYSLPTLTAWAQTDTTKSTLFQFGTSDMLVLPPDVADIQVTTASKSAESLRDAAASITVISAAEIEGFGALSMRDVLDRVVSVYVTGSYFMPNNIISIRGDVTNNYNTHVLILFDGRPVRENLFNGFNSSIYSGIPLSSIERIEVVRGPGSVLYGTSAFAGVVNIILKKGKKNTTQASYLAGTDNTHISEVSTGFDKGKLKFATSFRHFSSKGWDFKALDFDSLLIDERVSTQGFGANAHISYGDFQVNSFLGIDRSENFAEGEFERLDTYRQVENTRLFIDLGYKKQLTKWWNTSLNLTYNRSKYIEDFAIANFNGRGQEHDAYSTDLLLEWVSYLKPLSNMNIVLGGTGNYFTGLFKQMHLTPDSKPYDFTKGPINPNPRLSIPLYDGLWYSGYFQADYVWKKKLKIVAGAQYNRTDNKQNLVPRIGLVYTHSSRWVGKLSYGQAFRTGSSYERRSTENEAYGNPNLLPEIAQTFEAHIGYTHPEQKVNISLTTFNNFTNNLIALDVDSASIQNVPQYINLNKIQYHGLELEGSYKITKHILLTNAFTWQDATTLVEGGKKTLHQSTGIPQFMFKTGFLYRNSKNGINLGVFHSYYGKVTPLTVYNIAGKIHDEAAKNYNHPIHGYHYLSLNLNVDVRTLFEIDNIPSITFGLFIQNVLNAHINYAEYSRSEVNSIPGRGGRGIYGRMAVRF
jgi:outer membrane receptor for ferrienterochelin and colicins